MSARRVAGRDKPGRPEQVSTAAPGPRSGWWRRILDGKNWMVVVLVTAIVGVSVPWAFPSLIDSTRDLGNSTPLVVEAGDASDLVVGTTVLATNQVVRTNGGMGEIIDLVTRADGIPAGQSGQRVSFRNRRSSTILVTDLRPVVERRDKPLNGTLVQVKSEGEGQTTALDLDLDAQPPLPTGRDDRGERTGRPFFSDRHLELAPGETHLVQLSTVTRRCSCTWRLRVTYRYRDAEHTMTVPAPDQPPFRMTAYTRPYRAVYVIAVTGITRPDPRTYCPNPRIC